MSVGDVGVVALGCTLVIVGGLAGVGAVGSATGAVPTADGGVSPGADALTGENDPPIVDAGLDREVAFNETVYLDATGSYDPDGEIDRYEWRIERPDGTYAHPDCRTCARTQFIARQSGRYNVTVTVTDDDGAQRSDTLWVTVDNAPPVVTAPTAPTLEPGETVTLTGSATDPDGDDLTYRWETPPDSPLSLASATSPTVTVTAPAVDGNYEYDLALTVSDGQYTRRDTTTVHVDDPNISPRIWGVSNETVLSHQTATLSAEMSDPDDDPEDLSVSWRVPGAPGADIDGDGYGTATFSPPHVSSETTYTVVAQVEDPAGATDTTRATVTVRPGRATSTSGDSSGGSGNYSSSGSIGFRYKDQARYDEGWCTSPRGGSRADDCEDSKRPVSGDRVVVIDEDADGWITLDYNDIELTIAKITDTGYFENASIVFTGAQLDHYFQNAFDAYTNGTSPKEVAYVKGTEMWAEEQNGGNGEYGQ